MANLGQLAIKPRVIRLKEGFTKEEEDVEEEEEEEAVEWVGHDGEVASRKSENTSGEIILRGIITTCPDLWVTFIRWIKNHLRNNLM